MAVGPIELSRIDCFQHFIHTGEYQGIPATGKRIVITFIDIALIKAGKIVEEWVEFDLMNILQQISVRKHQQ